MTKTLNNTQGIPTNGDNITPKKKEAKNITSKKEDVKNITEDKKNTTTIKLDKETVTRINKLILIEQGIRGKKIKQEEMIKILIDEYDIKEMNKDARV